MGTKKKYVLTDDTMVLYGLTLHHIKAVISFGDVKEGDLGGWIESEKNLSHSGDAWVYGDARVCGDARVYGDAMVYGNARVCGDARVYGDARVCGDAWVYGDARVYGNARVCGDAEVYGNAMVYGDARVCGDAWVCGDAQISSGSDHCGFDCFGSANRHTHAYRTKNGGIEVTCGCFRGDLKEFAKKVEATHAGTIYEKQYNAIIDLIKIKF